MIGLSGGASVRIMRVHIVFGFLVVVLFSADLLLFDGGYSDDAWQRVRMEAQGLRHAAEDVARKILP